MTPTQALFILLQDRGEGWHHKVLFHEGSKQVRRLFVTHDSCVQLARLYPEVALVNGTYRTNWYNMPLMHFMHVVPVSGQNRACNESGSNLSVGFCFSEGEDEESYT